jgi:pimeloyl-ACP methyl ester carboxylesterase
VLSETEKQGYLAPYPNAFYKAAFRQFPKFIPDKYNYPGADIGRSSKQFWQNKWQGESFVAVGAQDQILADTTKQLAQDVIRGCPDPMVIDDAGHFLFEWGDQILKSALRSFSF